MSKILLNSLMKELLEGNPSSITLYSYTGCAAGALKLTR